MLLQSQRQRLGGKQKRYTNPTLHYKCWIQDLSGRRWSYLAACVCLPSLSEANEKINAHHPDERGFLWAQGRCLPNAKRRGSVDRTRFFTLQNGSSDTKKPSISWSTGKTTDTNKYVRHRPVPVFSPLHSSATFPENDANLIRCLENRIAMVS